MTEKHWPAELAVAALKREGVDVMFGLLGGHINAIQDYAYRAGIDVFQVRHEQAAAHAADGYARVNRRPGVFFATAGPGMTNTVTGLHMASLARSPVVGLFGGHKLSEQGRGGTVQEGDACSVLASVTKWTKRVYVPEQADLYIRQAFRDAMTYPYGPVAIEFPVDIFNYQPISAASQIGYLAEGHLGAPPPVAGTTDAVRAAFELLSSAERPLILAGDGVHWDDAGEELRAFVTELRIPVTLRRLARGAVPEEHPLVLPASLRKKAIEQADVVMVLSMNLDYFEGFGDWRTDAQFIQVNRHPSEIALNLRTAVEVTADPRTFLSQLREVGAREQVADESREPWIQRWTAAAGELTASRDREADEARGAERIHPSLFAKELVDVLPDEVPVILDSFTASGYLTQYLRPRFSGSVLDAGLSAAFGHGVGMALGASVARGYKPVVTVLGDGGIGLAGGDIETAVRYNIPVVFIVYNNSTLCGGLEEYAYGKDFHLLGPKARGGFNLTQDVAYEEMYGVLGLHAEVVTKPDEVGPALTRALESGGPAVLNVLAERSVQHNVFDSASSRDMMWYLPIDEVEEPARKRHHEVLYPRYHQGRTVQEDMGSDR